MKHKQSTKTNVSQAERGRGKECENER